MNRKKKLLTGVLCCVFAAILLISGALIATHLQHDCPGEGCPVCTAISARERLLRCMALTAASGSVFLLAQRSLGISIAARLNGAAAHTLVTLKVKLSD